MTDKTMSSVVAIFPDRGKAEAAVDQLWHAGFQKEQIGIAAPGEDLHRASTRTEAIEEKAADGAVMGAVTGSAFGALAGALVVATLPGIGPILAGGWLAGVLSGAAAGAALGTFAGPFVAMGLSEGEIRRVETALRAGRTVVVVRVEDQPEKALMILRSHAPVYAAITGPQAPVHSS